MSSGMPFPWGAHSGRSNIERILQAQLELEIPALLPIADIWVAARWADGLIYLKTVSETRAKLTFGRQRYVQTIGR
jgi:hypothetical protein